CQIDRLALIAGEFQRVSLSATVRPPEKAAEFVGGIDQSGIGREVSIVAPVAEKKIELTIAYPDSDEEIMIDKYGRRYSGLINYILGRIGAHTTLLVFTDSRRRAERLCYYINEEAAFHKMQLPAAFAHHGSLSRELRLSVEKRLAAGELPCLVATASLELGIDIGSVDEVVLAGSPASVSQALQRIGRSGHGVGKTSRGRLFPFHGMDLLRAAALKNAVDDREIEETHSIENPLDILAQTILALCTEKKQNLEELFTALRRFYIFKTLNKDSFMRTVRMLAGLSSSGTVQAGTAVAGSAASQNKRLREIKPRIWLDNITGEIGALDGILMLLYSSGGVIANRGMYSLRLADGVKIGELDEEFVWERRIGDCFHFGGRDWKITAISAESVEARPLESISDFIPFWKADTIFRSPVITARILAILDNFNNNDIYPQLTDLVSFIDSQRMAQSVGKTGPVPLSGSGNITVEIIDSPENSTLVQAGQLDFFSVVIHSFRGGTVNYPLTLALAQELEETLQLRVESFSNDDAILFLLPRPGIVKGGSREIQELIKNAFISLNGSGGGGLCRGERLFRNRLETSGIFGANFREAAERSLLLPKAGFGKRTPLWIMRQRSKRLFDAVIHEDGFPVTAEAWRSCLVDMFDMNGYTDLLGAINDGSITLSFFHTCTPSPFSRDMVHQETNTLMYEYDERNDLGSKTGKRSASLSDKVIEDALGDSTLRPVLKSELVDDFTLRLRREIPGWAPEDSLSLCEWVKERIAIPADEWETLLTALPEELKQEIFEDERLKIVKPEGADTSSIVHREWETAWKNEALTLLGPWLRYEGPISIERIAGIFGVSTAEAEDAINALCELDELVNDVQVTKNETPNSLLYICDRENLEMLLRLSRKKARPIIREQPASALIPFIAARQGLAGEKHCSKENPAGNASFLKTLCAYPAPAKLWETEFSTARCENYSPELLDSVLKENDFAEGQGLIWYGTGKEKISFCTVEDLDLVFTGDRYSKESPPSDSVEEEIFSQMLNTGFFDRPRGFWEIKDKMTGNNNHSRNCAKTLWNEVWKGRLSSDSFEPVRRGIENGFTVKEPETMEPAGLNNPFTSRRAKIPRALRDRWKEGAPVRGEWFSLAADESSGEENAMDEEYRNRDRIRLLLNRWGILCRPLLEHESPPFTWSGLLPAMRRMELSGELVAGRFFSGINSLQFSSAGTANELA
ncbi:MAG: hypothetical protein FWF22_08240, partial [Treponema sp.]|nr:hypothetical protein [Treponema sp.]